MRRWKVVLYDMETGEAGPPRRFFRHFAAQRAADRKNAQLTLSQREYARCLYAHVIDERFERRALRQKRLSTIQPR